MKSFRNVEATRRAYHADAALNSVHRSSLIVPELPGAEAEISFLNHFLLKRSYDKVACRITAVDAQGRRIESRLVPITGPKVYTIPLTGMVDVPAATYLVEFFAAENLFIPFPAVIVNHRGPGFLNTVHSYNRVLNDVFEDDDINAAHQREAAIDLRLDEAARSFLLFSSGPQPVEGVLDLALMQNGATGTAKVPVSLPKLGRTLIDLGTVFPNLAPSGGILTVQQPPQFLFYGRMLVGQMAPDGAFSGNHSYYDCSGFAEYWDDARPSERLYPFIPALDSRIRFYPIISPGRIAVTITPRGSQGEILGTLEAGTLEVPGTEFIDLSVNALCRDAGIDAAEVAAFAVHAAPIAGNTPTRINHQLVFGSGSGLEASINMSLVNPNTFTTGKRKGFSWGEIPLGGEQETWLGLTTNAPTGAACDLHVAFYGEEGRIGERAWTLPAGTAIVARPEEVLPEAALAPYTERPGYVWFEIRSDRPDVYGYSISRNRRTGHCTGEHSF